MSGLLYIEASPRKKRSASIEVAHAYLDAYRENHPNSNVEVLDLWQNELPRFDADIIDAKYAIMHGQSQTEAQRKSWRVIEEAIAVFKKADHYLFSLPMWNFGIPYQLSHYFALIVQPTYTFSFSPSEGYKGLVTGKPAVLICSRGGAYGPGTGGEALDFQKTYMETILKFIGFTDIQTILVEPTLGGPEAKDKAVSQAKEEAICLAK